MLFAEGNWLKTPPSHSLKIFQEAPASDVICSYDQRNKNCGKKA